MSKALKLASNFVVLNDSFQAETVAVTDDLYKRLDEEYKEFAGHLLISSYAFDADWPTWEVHPAGDEFVILVSGDVDLVLAKEGGDETVRLSEPGTFAIIPRNTWHTARVRSHSVMMFITPGEGTINSEEPVRTGS
jgi:mannose-6-phosphate isomerase-like protein (cupin superfamily)